MLEQASNSTLYLILFAAVIFSFVIGFIVKFITDRRTRKDHRSIAGELEVKRVRYKKLRNDFQQLQTKMDHQRVELHKLSETKNSGKLQQVELEKALSELQQLQKENLNLKKSIPESKITIDLSLQHKELKKKFVLLQKNHNVIKSEYDRLKQSNQVHADYDALFQAHQQLKKDFDLIRLQSRELEIENHELRKTGKERSNS